MPDHPRVALVTDSSSQITDELAERFDVRVVPLTVTIDGEEFVEGVELDADTFYAKMERADDLPSITTAQPSPAAFLDAFTNAADSGADVVLPILVGSDYSGTVNSATLAVGQLSDLDLDLDVRIVDTGAASFGVTCCVWAAADAIAAGAPIDDVIAAAQRRADETESVFILQGIELANRSGRFDRSGLAQQDGDGIAVLWSGRGVMDVIATVHTIDDAVDAMVQRMGSSAADFRAAVGWAGTQTAPITEAFDRRVRELPNVVEVVSYRVGPSIAAHTGPGTAGGFFFPAH